MPALDFIIIFSLGRSGSTFLAKALSENSDYANGGENRYFWQELIKRPPEEHPAEIERFFSAKASNDQKVIDKTPDLYRYIDRVNFGSHHVRFIELVRAPEAIAASRENFVSSLVKPSRWKIRIRNYRRDYGGKWFIPILQRWYLIPAIFGIGRDRAFATGDGQQTLKNERAAFDAQMARLRGRCGLLTVDYDNFAHTIGHLSSLGFSIDQIDRIKQCYRR